MAQLDIDFSKQYLEWLKQNIEQYQVRDSIFRITLPFWIEIMIVWKYI